MLLMQDIRPLSQQKTINCCFGPDCRVFQPASVRAVGSKCSWCLCVQSRSRGLSFLCVCVVTFKKGFPSTCSHFSVSLGSYALDFLTWRIISPWSLSEPTCSPAWELLILLLLLLILWRIYDSPSPPRFPFRFLAFIIIIYCINQKVSFLHLFIFIWC